MSVRDLRRAAMIVLATFLLGGAAIIPIGWHIIRYPERAAAGPERLAKVVIDRGASLHEIARRLYDRGIIEHPWWFRQYANERGVAQKVRAGQYSFSSRMTPSEILDRLIEGVPVEELSVTIPEGKNLLQVAELLDEAGICSREDTLRLMRSPQFVAQEGLPGPTVEGYLFPDTYRFKKGLPAARVLGVMIKHARDVITQLKAKHGSGVAMLASQYKFGERELVIMASLVEKETAQPVERPRIAGLFLNRLRLPTFVPHLLQTDPTIVYGCTVPLKKSEACSKFEGRIRRIHLDDKDNPYNTYTHEGLPPGPICNPGRAALEAVLAPDKTPYLYFVSKNDGTHYFSKTRAEHEAAVDKYQRHNTGPTP